MMILASARLIYPIFIPLLCSAGYYRGVIIPLATISAVRAASFTMYTETKDFVYTNQFLANDRLRDIALAGWLGGATSGCVLSVGSTRTSVT